MNNDAPTQVTDGVQISAMTLGQWLTQARQASGLSVQDVAQRTNRSIAQITELEADDLSSFGAHVLLRGMIRQYTKAVGADETQALKLIPEQIKPSNPLEGLGIKDSQNIPKKTAQMGKPWLPRIWIVLLSILVLALLAYWVFGARLLKDKDALQKMSNANQMQITNPPAPVVTTPAPPATETVAPTAPATPTAPIVDQTPAPVPAVSEAVLGLKFKGVVWIQVKDAKGTVLVSGTQPAGSEQNLKGELPLSIVIGDVTGVDMTWKGQPYDLKSATKGRATVAKINGLE